MINLLYPNKSNLIKTLLFIIVSFQLIMRPSLLQGYGNILFPISVFFMIILLILKKKSFISKNGFLYILFSFLFVIFLIIQSFFSKDGTSPVLFNVSLSILLPVFLVLCINPNNWETTLKAVIYPILLFSISYLITFLLFFAGMDLSNLQYYSFDIVKSIGEYHVVIYFPFSMGLEYDFPGLNLKIVRTIGYFREPGIFSPVVAFSFFGLDYLKFKYKVVFKLLLLFSLIMTFSTAGFVSFILAFIYYYFISEANKFNKIKTNNFYKILILIISIPFIYLAVFGDYRFGLISKLSQNSGQERLSSISESIEILQKSPLLGVGYPSTKVSGVTFLSTLGQIGIIGGALFLLIFIIPFLNKIKNRRSYFSIIYSSFCGIYFFSTIIR